MVVAVSGLFFEVAVDEALGGVGAKISVRLKETSGVSAVDGNLHSSSVCRFDFIHRELHCHSQLHLWFES